MKTILVSLTLTLLASSAVAEKARPPSKAKAKKPNFGESFDLKARNASRPRDVDPAIVSNVTERQPGRVIKDKMDDLENCWLKLPAGKRVASAATLRVTIEAAGTVTQARVDGELPVGVAKCITSAAHRWTFPVAEARSEIEHGITLTTR